MLIFIMQANATALMMAIYHGLSGVVEALLRAEPDVNITATGVRLPHLSILDLQYSSHVQLSHWPLVYLLYSIQVTQH